MVPTKLWKVSRSKGMVPFAVSEDLAVLEDGASASDERAPFEAVVAEASAEVAASVGSAKKRLFFAGGSPWELESSARVAMAANLLARLVDRPCVAGGQNGLLHGDYGVRSSLYMHQTLQKPPRTSQYGWSAQVGDAPR